MIAYHPNATDDQKRYRNMCRMVERLKRRHKARRATLPDVLTPRQTRQFKAWEKDVWIPRLKRAAWQRGEILKTLQESDISYRQPRNIEDLDKSQALKFQAQDESQWDIDDGEFDRIEPMGREHPIIDPTEDFTTYTEVDASGFLSQTAARASWTDLPRDTVTYLYDDKGAAHFSGDWSWLYETQETAQSGSFALHGLVGASKTLGDLLGTQFTAGDVYQGSYWYNNSGAPYFALVDADNTGTETTDTSSTMSLSTSYYITFDRDESVGTYGTLYLYIYTDSGRTSLFDTLTVTIPDAKEDLRYVIGPLTYDSNHAARISTGYMENLDLQEGGAATPTRTIGFSYGQWIA